VNLHPRQVSSEHQAEGSQHKRGRVDGESRGFEGSALDLFPGLAVAHVAGENRSTPAMIEITPSHAVKPGERAGFP
jgi:hypothetical protein